MIPQHAILTPLTVVSSLCLQMHREIYFKRQLRMCCEASSGPDEKYCLAFESACEICQQQADI